MKKETDYGRTEGQKNNDRAVYHEKRAAPERNLTPTITGCDSGQTTDRKEDDSFGKKPNHHRVISGSDRPIKFQDKQPSEIRLRFKKNLQADFLNLQAEFMDHYLDVNSKITEESTE